MKKNNIQLIPASNQENTIDLDQSKLLIGSSSNCDVILNHNSISYYHALIESDNNGTMLIIDLNSPNGIFINGIRVQNMAPLTADDTLTIGKMHYSVLLNEEKRNFKQLDSDIEITEIEQRVYVPQQGSSNEVLIDNEYCDIIFDESHFNPIKEISVKNISITDYIEPVELEESFELEKRNYTKCIQITTLVTGSILDQFYLPLNLKSIRATQSPQNNAILIDCLKNENEDFLSLVNSKLSIKPLEGFEITQTSLNLDDESTVIIMNSGTYQVFIEISNVPTYLVNIPQIKREKDFLKESSKVFAGIMLPLLFLLFINFDIPKPKKKLSIIYKKPTPSKVDGKKLASTNPVDKVKNTGQKSIKQPEKKISRNKAGKKALKKTKTRTKKINKVAKTQKAPPKPIKKSKAPVKAYQFKMASNVKNIFSNSKSSSKSVAQTATRSIASSSASVVTESLNTKVNGTASNKVGNLGSDLAGAQASMGTRGLSSKSGRDTSYIQTKTVVLGSMDPELLRKILQRYLPQFRHCYQEELANNSEDIKGIVDLNFTISGSGKVTKMDIKAKDRRFSKNGINCMGKVLSIIDFPKPKGGGRVAVRQPLSFFSEQESS